MDIFDFWESFEEGLLRFLNCFDGRSFWGFKKFGSFLFKISGSTKLPSDLTTNNLEQIVLFAKLS